MVIRGYPEEAVRRKVVIEPKEVIEPKDVVRYVYSPTERTTLDPNLALIALAITIGAGIIALAMVYKDKK